MEFVQKIPIKKGWSDDKKYCVTTAEGEKYLLRVSSAEKKDRIALLYQIMKQVDALGVPMCRPLEFGSCPEGVYLLQSFIEGEDAEQVICTKTDTEQYVYGLEAGRYLRKIHSIPVPGDGEAAGCKEDWETRFNRKIDRKIKNYQECPIKCKNGQAFIDYIENNRHLLHGRPQCFQHGDYHIGNMMIDKNGHLQIIDFDRFDFGDPWEEFNRIVWSAQTAPLFASGMLNGYFDGAVPEEFFRLLALYIASNILSSVPWAISFGQSEVDTMMKQAEEVLSWYDNMEEYVPSWYFRGYYLQTTDGVPYKLKSSFDFTFLRKYGTVFKVFDDQDSGNICFGTEKDGKRYFVKFAGAPTEQYNGNPADAVARLRATVPVYEAISQRSLIRYLFSEDISGGFACVFEWAEGECMGRMYPASRKKFMAMSLKGKCDVFHDIISFLKDTAAAGFVAIDFYDGSILYDFINRKTSICDIDFFRKMPCVNDLGRMWGSSLFMSPEEFVKGEVLDEVTNVYTLGAFAFALFANYDRNREAFSLGEKAYEVAKRAVSDERSKRQQSILQFLQEWEEAR